MHDIDFFVAAIATLFLIALLKGAFSGGFALIGVPTLALFIHPIQAAAIIAPLVCLMDVFAVMIYPPRTWDARHPKLIIPGSLIGMVLGALLLGRAPEWAVGLIVGWIAVIFSSQWFARRLGLISVHVEVAPGRRAGYFWGGCRGFPAY